MTCCNHSTPQKSPGGIVSVIEYQDYLHLRSATGVESALAIIIGTETIEIYDWVADSTGLDSGDGDFIKPDGVDATEEGRWVRKTTFGSGGGEGGGLSEAEIQALIDASMDIHEGGDTHPDYLDATEVAILIAAAIATHEGESDPHPQYMTEEETDAAIQAAISASRSILICLTD